MLGICIGDIENGDELITVFVESVSRDDNLLVGDWRLVTVLTHH